MTPELTIYLLIEPPDDECYKVLKFNVNIKEIFESGVKRFSFTINKGIPGRYAIRTLIFSNFP